MVHTFFVLEQKPQNSTTGGPTSQSSLIANSSIALTKSVNGIVRPFSPANTYKHIFQTTYMYKHICKHELIDINCLKPFISE